MPSTRISMPPASQCDVNISTGSLSISLHTPYARLSPLYVLYPSKFTLCPLYTRAVGLSHSNSPLIFQRSKVTEGSDDMKPRRHQRGTVDTNRKGFERGRKEKEISTRDNETLDPDGGWGSGKGIGSGDVKEEQNAISLLIIEHIVQAPKTHIFPTTPHLPALCRCVFQAQTCTYRVHVLHPRQSLHTSPLQAVP